MLAAIIRLMRAQSNSYSTVVECEIMPNISQTGSDGRSPKATQGTKTNSCSFFDAPISFLSLVL